MFLCGKIASLTAFKREEKRAFFLHYKAFPAIFPYWFASLHSRVVPLTRNEIVGGYWGAAEISKTFRSLLVIGK